MILLQPHKLSVMEFKMTILNFLPSGIKEQTILGNRLRITFLDTFIQ